MRSLVNGTQTECGLFSVCSVLARGCGTYTAGTVNSLSLLKVAQKSVDFPCHFCTFDDPDVIKLISQNPN